jgi:hypothetical protein
MQTQSKLRAYGPLCAAGVLLFTAASLGPAGCGSSGGGPTDAGPDAGDGGGDAGPSWSAPVSIDNTPVRIDATQNSFSDMAAAVDPNGRPAVAYFETRSDAGPDAGDYGTYPLILARELSDGVWTKEVVPAAIDGGAVTGHYGVALAFDSSGNPLVTYQGGVRGVDKGVGDDRWHNNATGLRMPADSVLARKSGGAWTRSITLSQLSNAWVTDGFAVDDQGEIVGLWSAMAVDNAGTVHVVQQDSHFGVDQSAYDDANLEYHAFSAAGAPSGSGEMVASNRVGPACDATVPPCSASGKVLVQGAGLYTKMVIGTGGAPAVAFVNGPYQKTPVNVWFGIRNGTSTPWNLAKLSGATGSFGHPPALTFSASGAPDGSGPLYAVAYYDHGGDDLRLATSKDGATFADNPIETLGVTGLHPAAAFSGATLGLLYAYCRGPVDSPLSCNATTQEIRFRSGPADAAQLFGPTSYESVAPGVSPDGTALVADGQGRFVAIWRDPAGGIFASRRTP